MTRRILDGRSYRPLAALACLSAASAFAQPLITTYAGGLPSSVPALSLPLGNVSALATDAAGNTYIASKDLHAVYKLDTQGNLTLVAGTGSPGTAGDGGLATAAQLDLPMSVAVDTAGNVYIGDLSYRVRKVSAATGLISTYVGSPGCNGPSSYRPLPDGPVSAGCVSATALAIDSANNLYVVDSSTVRKVANGSISTLNPGTFPSASSLALTATGDLYVGGHSDNVLIYTIWKYTNGAFTDLKIPVVNSFAIDASGNAVGPSLDGTSIFTAKLAGGPITTTPIVAGACNFPSSVVFAKDGGLLIGDNGCGLLRKLSGNSVTTVAGTGGGFYYGENIPATTAVTSPNQVVLDSKGNLYLSEPDNNRVRKVHRAESSPPSPATELQASRATGDRPPRHRSRNRPASRWTAPECSTSPTPTTTASVRWT
jgi:hypothetical protein